MKKSGFRQRLSIDIKAIRWRVEEKYDRDISLIPSESVSNLSITKSRKTRLYMIHDFMQ